MRKILCSLGMLCLLGARPLWAVGGDGERQASVDPTFTNNGNTWRIVVVTPTVTLTLLSTAPAKATVASTSTISLGIQVYRERFIVNLCTAAALAIYPSNAGYTQFSSSVSLIISSAPAGGTSWVSVNNSRYFYHQDEIWGVWDTGSQGGGPSPNPPCSGGAVIMEEYYSGSQDVTKRR